MHIHHLGIASDDADAAADRFAALLDGEICHRETLDDVSVTMLEVPNGYLEFLEPTGDGAVKRFLDRRGPGMHHIAFETDDIRTALERAKTLDIQLVDTDPRPGAMGHEVAFLHPKSLGGVLVEFVET